MILRERQFGGQRGRRFLFAALVGIFVFLLFSGLLISRATASIAQNMNDGRAALEQAETALRRYDFSGARDSLTRAGENLNRARLRLNRWNFLSSMPWIGGKFNSAAAFIDSAAGLIRAFEDIAVWADKTEALLKDFGVLSFALPEPTLTFEKLSAENKRALLAQLHEARTPLKNARTEIDAALDSTQNLRASAFLPQLKIFVDSQERKLREFRGLTDGLLAAAEIIPPLAGYPQEQTQLLLLQNNTELRPTGGFWGTIGLLKTRDGNIESLATADVYALDRPAEAFLKVPAPEPIVKYLGASHLFLRDANWAPDFPVSARTALNFFEAEAVATPFAAIRPDGVIAFTPTIIQELLRLVGPLTVGKESFTAENVVDKLEYQVEIGYAGAGIPEAQRKEIVGALATSLLNKLFALKVSEWPQFLRILENAFAERHVLLFSRNLDLQAAFAERGWDGAVRQTDDDFLLVIDANLGSLKSDPRVMREISYSIQNTVQGLRAETRITYKHTGGFDWKTTRYRTYTRLYVPEGSRLISASGLLENDKIRNPQGLAGEPFVGAEFGKTVFGGFTAIEPGETREIKFIYLLPPRIGEWLKKGAYHLVAQKQSGTPAYPLTLELNFDKKLKTASPPEDVSEWGDGVYKLRTDLRVDRDIKIGF